ncbi:hypothetical protein BDW02DRAFT_313327 [Decorospora gaudefroyi]|uniref:Zn(2)-C6 fungal-type domain-containing protein n=1 Tax=Decorospora gaudefroyi TaxID=184978 RepID=A0A6A5KGW2_9PLEO|nr:hypothetical protein BDW02DRAFT_313327 [Decorospora gaudefroyi]
MSYRGRPSKGCEACRTRKVKCDETRPACSRCSKAKHECRYRDQADLYFRNQTASAAQRAEESWRKRSKSNQPATTKDNSPRIESPPSDESTPPNTDDQPSSSSSVHSPSGSADDHAHEALNELGSIIGLNKMTITPTVNPHFRRKAFERFVYDFVLPDSPLKLTDEPVDSLWAFIPVLYQGASEDSLIAKAVDAVSYVNFANRFHAPQAEALGEACLGKGIAMLTKIIANKKHSATNEALCSVYLMGVYENLTSVQRKGTFMAHHHGANALLQLRSIEQYYSDPVSAKLYEVAYAQMLLGTLQSANRPPLPKKEVVKVEEHLPSLYSNSSMFVIRLIWREAMLHARWHEVKMSTSPPTSRLGLQELLQSALELENDFQAWESDITPAWNYKVMRNTPQTRSMYDAKWQHLFLGCRGAPEEIHSYPTLKRCWIWGFYRTSRIFLLRDLLEMLNWMFRFPEPSPLSDSMDTSETSAPQEASIPTELSNVNLRTRHSVATSHLVELIEKNCSSLISSFTVPIQTKSMDDVVGMRGYVCFWPLGIMDSVLSSGLVPHTNASHSRSSAGTGPTQASAYSHPLSNRPTPTSAASSTSSPNQQWKNLYAKAPQFSELSNIKPSPENDQTPSTGESASTSTPVLDRAAKKSHFFDSSPTHAYDRPLELPPVDFDIVEPKRIDVAARREWINRLMYYLAMGLGIKKALYVPLTEGFIPTVKPSVDRVMGR